MKDNDSGSDPARFMAGFCAFVFKGARRLFARAIRCFSSTALRVVARRQPPPAGGGMLFIRCQDPRPCTGHIAGTARSRRAGSPRGPVGAPHTRAARRAAPHCCARNTVWRRAVNFGATPLVFARPLGGAAATFLHRNAAGEVT